MTQPTEREQALVDAAREFRQKWDANPNEVHKRPPFKAHDFDTNGRNWWVVGSTLVSVLGGWHGSKDEATAIASALS